MVAQSILQIILQLKDQASQGLKTTDGRLENLKKTALSLARGVGIAAASITAAGFTIKQVFEFGKQGAELEYLQTKFDRLSASIHTTSNALMIDLREATKGLVSDAELVKNAGDLMALGLADTHDEVVRLTRVAGQLGMDMNQLTLTLTNQTTMRFDSLGVSVAGFEDRLKNLKDQGMDTNEAFTEAFLQQAEEQIARVGDVADESIGDYKRLEANIANVSDELKMRFAPYLADAAEATLLLLDANKNLSEALQEHKDDVGETSQSYRDYVIEIVRSTALTMAWKSLLRGPLAAVDSINAIKDLFVVLNKNVYEAKKAVGGLNEAEKFLDRTNRVLATSTEVLIKKYQTTHKYLEKMTVAAGELENAMRDEQDAIHDLQISTAQANVKLARQRVVTEEAAVSMERLGRAQRILNAGLSGELIETTKTYQGIIREAADANNELVEQYRILADEAVPETTEEMANLKKQIDLNNLAQAEALQSMKDATREMIYQQASAGLDADAALVLALAMGVISEEDYALITAIEELKVAFDKNADGMLSATEVASGYADAINDIYKAVIKLQGEGVNVSYGTVGGGTVTTPAGQTWHAGPGDPGYVGGGSSPLVFNYSPWMSTASQDEAESKLRPIIESILRGNG